MNGVEWVGQVPAYTNTNVIRLWFLMQVPSGGTTNGEGLVHVVTSGSAARWSIIYGTGGTLELKAFDVDGVELDTSGAVAFDVDGKLLRVALELTEDGADTDYRLATLEVGESTGALTTGTVTGESVNRATAVVVNPGGELTDTAIGHISVHDDDGSIFDLFEELNAYSGETAGDRLIRLCAEEGLTFRAVGDSPAVGPFSSSAAMGYQLPATLIDLLRECEAADGGILFEPRDLLGLAYRARESLYHQEAALALDYDAGELGALEPTDDDRQVRNDVTVTRAGGSSARAVLESGALSILAPPDGVGRYDTEVELSLADDSTLTDRAGWLLHLGTVDEARYPRVTLNLATLAGRLADPALNLAAQDLDVGDRLTIADLPAWLPPDDVSLLAVGSTEVLAPYTHRLELTCEPETPWGQAATYDADDARYSSAGSTLDEALDTTETGVDVATASGPLWSDADAPFDVMVGGERMTVSAITGSSSPQTFTVTRSANGVVKTHAAGAPVELAHPSVYVP
jgi:hypothetical protein